MHLYMGFGLYQVLGRPLSMGEAPVYLLRTPCSNILVNTGRADEVEILVRNLLELGVGISEVSYAIVTVPSGEAAGSCRILRELNPNLLTVASVVNARAFREGGKGLDPCPISIEVRKQYQLDECSGVSLFFNAVDMAVTAFGEGWGVAILSVGGAASSTIPRDLVKEVLSRGVDRLLLCSAAEPGCLHLKASELRLGTEGG